MRIVVTGAGSSRAARMRGIGGQKRRGRRPGTVRPAIRDAAAAADILADANVVVHLAATVGGVDFLKRNAVETFYGNLSMGMNVVHAICAERRPPGANWHGVQLSALATLPLCEDDIYSGLATGDTGPYGLAKAAVSTRPINCCRRTARKS